ncbi:MAG: PAS domain S-box protein [Ectothiorhodospiraceae bacterium]|nr:PAS domain S-box protein [Ectothiorhodospiraceae bacterium]
MNSAVPLPVNGGILDQLMDSPGLLACVKDADLRFQRISRDLAALLTPYCGSPLGCSLSEVLSPELAAPAERNDRQALASGHTIQAEETLLLGGIPRTFLSSRLPLKDTRGHVSGLCILATEITPRKRIETTLHDVGIGTAGLVDTALFRELVRRIALTLCVDLAYVAVIDGQRPMAAETLGICLRGQSLENIRYPLQGTPCRTVLEAGFQFIPDGLGESFPEDHDLLSMQVRSYAGYPLFDGHGQVLGLIAVAHGEPMMDPQGTEAVLRIHAVRAAAELERRRAERAGLLSQQSYQQIFDASEDAIFIHDLETGAILDVNPYACQQYGYTREELIQLDVEALSSGVVPYTQDEAAHLMRRAAKGEVVRFEWHRRNRDGSLHWDEVVLKRAELAGVPRILAFTREVSERRERELALQRSEDRLRATVEAALDCIICMDSNGCITEFNPAAERCFGYTRQNILGQPLAQLLIPERYRHAHQAGLEHYLQQGEGPFLDKRIEISAMRSDGSEFPVELAIAVTQDHNGQLFVAYLRDITAARAAEEARARLEDQLRQAQKMEALGPLTGGIAHDFNNILASILGYAVLADEQTQPAESSQLPYYLGQIRRSAEQARDLIRQMLAFSRGQRGEPRPVLVRSLVTDATRLYRSTFPATLRFHTEVESGLPAVLADPVLLEQALMNLAINARDAVDNTGEITITASYRRARQLQCASCRADVEGDWVDLSVADNGCGIPAELRDRIFEPVFSTKEVGHGSGMGLATIHGVFHEYGGHIQLDSEPGQGTCIHLLLPVSSASSVSPLQTR